MKPCFASDPLRSLPEYFRPTTKYARGYDELAQVRRKEGSIGGELPPETESRWSRTQEGWLRERNGRRRRRTTTRTRRGRTRGKLGGRKRASDFSGGWRKRGGRQEKSPFLTLALPLGHLLEHGRCSTFFTFHAHSSVSAVVRERRTFPRCFPPAISCAICG